MKIFYIIDRILYSIKILYSYCVLTNNLKSLYIKYKVDIIKRDFLYKFANKNTLFYKD